MLVLALVLFATLALAAVCAIRLTRPRPIKATTRPADVESMKVALERRMREGVDLRH